MTSKTLAAAAEQTRRRALGSTAIGNCGSNAHSPHLYPALTTGMREAEMENLTGAQIDVSEKEMPPQLGLEPTTFRLTARLGGVCRIARDCDYILGSEAYERQHFELDGRDYPQFAAFLR